VRQVVRVVKKGAIGRVLNFACKATRHVTSHATMPQDQPQTISVTDLDIAQLADVKKQLEEVRINENGAITLSHLTLRSSIT
jgi:hypothetical protein